jgi:hypothetical protein
VIAFLGKFMANSHLASVLRVFSYFTLTRVIKEGYSLPARRIPILEATQKRSLFLFSEIIEYKYLASASTSS